MVDPEESTEEELIIDSSLLTVFSSPWKLLNKFFDEMENILEAKIKDIPTNQQAYLRECFSTLQDLSLADLWVEVMELEESINNISKITINDSIVDPFNGYDDENDYQRWQGRRWGGQLTSILRKKLSDNISLVRLGKKKKKNGNGKGE